MKKYVLTILVTIIEVIVASSIVSNFSLYDSGSLIGALAVIYATIRSNQINNALITLDYVVIFDAQIEDLKKRISGADNVFTDIDKDYQLAKIAVQKKKIQIRALGAFLIFVIGLITLI